MEVSDGLQDTSVPVQQTSSNNIKSWEHAWSVDEIRKSAQQWSLAADVGLLEHMKLFASQLTAQAHDVSKEVSQLLHDTHLTDARVQTVTDYFLTLSDSQFIENRVYDEDDTVEEKKDEKSEEKQKTRDERDAEMFPRLKEAIKIGLTVIEDAYDVLDVAVGDSDSEADDDDLPSSEVILDPKDPYVARPLPHLIGSRGFHEEDDVGVGDLLSGDEAESEVGSMSESEDEIEKAPSVSDVSTSDYDSDDDSDVGESLADQAPIVRRKATTISSSDDYTSSEDGDLFTNRAKALESDSELESDEEKPITKKRAPSKKSQPEQGMFDDVKEDDNDLFSASGGLFGKTGGLFDAPKSGLFEGVEGFSDSEDEEEVKEQEKSSKPVEKKPAKQPPGKALPVGGVSLFGGAIKKGFFQGGGVSDSNDEEEDVASPPKAPAAKKSDLFDDDSEDDDLFGDEPPPTNRIDTSVKTAATKAAGGLFDNSESDEDLFSESQPAKATPTKQASQADKKPIGGVSMFGGGGGGALQDALRKRRPSSSGDDVQSSNSFTINSEISKSKQSNTNPKMTLFGDDDDSGDDLFTAMSKMPVSKNNFSKKRSKPTPAQSDSLFSPSGGDKRFTHAKDSSLPSSKNKKPKSPEHSRNLEETKTKIVDPLFGDSSDPLFAPPENAATTKKQKNEEVSNRFRSSGSKSNLFNTSDSDNDLFTTSSNFRPPPLNQDDSDDDDDDDDVGLFSNKPPPVKSQTLPLAKPAPKSSGLFGDSDDDNNDDDKPAIISKKAAPAKKQSTLFGDDDDSDDDLFSGMTKAKPAAIAPKQQSKVASSRTTPEKAKKPLTESTTSKKQKGKDLFDSDSDNDLFAPQSVPEKTIPKSDESPDSAAPPAEGTTEEMKEEAPKKRLAGAVSMFGAGGGELLAAINKRRSPSQKSNVSDSSVKATSSSKPTSSLFGDDDDDDLFGGSSKDDHPTVSVNKTATPFFTSSSASPPVITKVSAPKPRDVVGKLKTNLAINPASLLPGAAPKIVSTVDVDAPLQSVTKTRSKGQSGRRPPTRRARQKIAADAGQEIGVSSSTNASSASQTPTTAPQTPASSNLPSEKSKPSIDNDDFMNDLLSSSKSSRDKATAKKEPESSKKKKSKLPGLFDDDDLFESPKTVKKEKDLFDDDLFSTSEKSQKPTKPDVADDLFSADLDFEPKSSLFDEKPSKSKKTKLFDDDLFADVGDVKPASSKKKSSAPVENGDADIFSIKTTKTREKKSKKNEISALDADDLFGDSSPVISKKSSKSNATIKTKPLFDDSDDLFGGIPSSKTKKEKKKATIPDSLFDDDDIFSSAPQKTTKSSKKSKTSTAASKKADNPDIFDDPLSALLGP